MKVHRALFVGVGLVLIGGAGLFLYPKAEAQAISCDTPAEKAACQAQYDELQKEIAAQQVIISQTQAQERSLGGDITGLTAQITAAQKQIDAKNIQLKQFGSDITQKTAVIGQLSARIESGHESLASMLRQEDQLDDYSAAEVAFSADDLSTFFADADAFAQVEVNLQSLFTDIKGTKAETEQQKAALTDAQNKTTDAKYEVQTEQQKIATDKTQKQQLLTLTSSQEAQYQAVLAANQAKAAAISAALFPLRDAAAIQFGTALKYAQASEKSTGVDPALVLAILTQESNLGANVGQCYVTNSPNPGDGKGKNTGTPFSGVMNPTRDVPPFLALAKSLGFDASTQVVSCPIASAGGWGGAMGPAQFIPSTWALYASKIAAADGKSVANPWDPQDAITAMGFLLADNGASAGGYTAEYDAAARYYAGWNGPATSAGQSYGSQVMAKVAGIQKNIDFLANN